MFIRTWYPVSVPNFYNPVTSLLLPPDQKEKWQGMRSVGQLRKDLGLKAPVNTDSLYKVSHLLYLDIQRSFSHDDGIENITIEKDSLLFKLGRDYFDWCKISNVGEFPRN